MDEQLQRVLAAVLRAAGADAMWLLCGTTQTELAFDFVESGLAEPSEMVMKIEHPHPVILVAVFPYVDVLDSQTGIVGL